MAISSLGLGSGLDLGGLISSLVATERDPVLSRLEVKEANYTTELSAYGALKGAMSTFQTAVTTLNSASFFQGRTATTTDKEVFTASADSSATAGVYSLDITQVARAQTLISESFTNTTDAVGTGKITFRFGTYTGGNFTPNPDQEIGTVSIAATDNSLEGIRNAVNEANIGVSASIINDGNGNRLVFTGDDTGAANSLEITVDDDDLNNTDTSGLSKLAYDPTAGVGSGKNLTEPSSGAAQNAELTINGIAITSASNTVKEAVQGVTLNLLKDTGGSTETLNVTKNSGTVKKNVDSFIEAYNTMIETIEAVAGYDQKTQTGAILLGDSAVRSIRSQVRTMLNSPIDNLSGPFSTLVDIGVTTDSSGKLEVDSTKLQSAIDNNFDDIASLFAAIGTPSDNLIDFSASGSDTKIGDYAVKIDQLATQGLYAGAATASLADTATPGTFDTAFVVDADNDTFTLKVDGVQSGTITLTQGSYATTAELVTQIQSRINGDTALKNAGVSVGVSFDSALDKLSITSTRYGSASKVEFITVDANTVSELGISVASGTDGLDVAGTINGQVAAGSGRLLTSSTGDSKGLQIEVLGGTTGNRGNVTFSRGIADQLSTMLKGFLAEDGLIDAREDGIQASISEIQDERVALDQRIFALEARLTSQFIAMDTLVSNLQSTGNFLQQQLASISSIFKNKDN